MLKNPLLLTASAFVLAVFTCSSVRPGSDGHNPGQQQPIRPPERVAFPTEDGGLIYGDLYGEGDRGVVLAHGGRFNRRAGRNRLRNWQRPDFVFWPSTSAAMASREARAKRTSSLPHSTSTSLPGSIISAREARKPSLRLAAVWEAAPRRMPRSPSRAKSIAWSCLGQHQRVRPKSSRFASSIS